MGRNADGPPSGRMGFGYEQAKEAGIPWDAIKPRSPTKVNADIEARKAPQKTARGLASRLPKAADKARLLKVQGLSDEAIVAELESLAAEQDRGREALSRSKKK